MGKISAIRERIAQLGLGVTLLYALHRALPLLSRGHARLFAYGLYAQPVGGGQQPPLPADRRTVVQQVQQGHPLERAFPRDPEVIHRRWRKGSDCYAISVHDQFAGHIWVARGAYDEDEVHCRYELTDTGNSVWDFDVYVEPRWRFGRTMARLWHGVDEALAAQGVRWSFSRISLFNEASLRAHQRLGAVPRGRLAFLVLGPVQVTAATVAPYFDLRWRPTSHPTIRLSPPARV